jgi:hypothetical protein
MIALRIVLIIANALFLVFAAYLAWALGWMTNTYAEVKPWLAWAIVALFTLDLLYLLLHPALPPGARKSLGNSLKHRDTNRHPDNYLGCMPLCCDIRMVAALIG